MTLKKGKVSVINTDAGTSKEPTKLKIYRGQIYDRIRGGKLYVVKNGCSQT